MPQITLYLDEETEALLRTRPRAAGLSYSRWVVELIRGNAARTWPPEVAQLAGAFPDFPLREEPPPSVSSWRQRARPSPP